MEPAAHAAACLFLYARAFSCRGVIRLTEPRLRPSTVSPDGVTLEPTWLGWLQRAADATRKLGPSGAVSLDGAAQLHGQHAFAGYRWHEHGALAGSACSLLDTPLVEYVMVLPEKMRRRAGEHKALLTAAVGDVMPPEILTQKKRTFTLPWEGWMRGASRARVEESFANPAPALVTALRWNGVRDLVPLSRWQDFVVAPMGAVRFE